jgi:hypothetical protein
MTMTKEEIIIAAENIFNRFTQTCKDTEETLFFERPDTKWSVAENVQHLIISTNTTTLAYSLPKFMVRWVGGTPNRASRTFDELAAKYYKKLEEGGKASARYVPRPIEIKYGKEKLITNWNRATQKFLSALQNNRTEADLDNYLASHPLLGRITLRELGYFTIFHTEHHLNSILKRTHTAP